MLKSCPRFRRMPRLWAGYLSNAAWLLNWVATGPLDLALLTGRLCLLRLGQVHKATSLDGQSLAVKLQYPEWLMIDADRPLSWIPAIAFDSAISTADIHTELSTGFAKSWIIQGKRQI